MIIPTGWNKRLISDLCAVVRGSSPRPAGSPLYFRGNYLPWITVREVTKNNSLYLNSTETSLTKEGSKHTRVIEAGTFILTNSGATLGVPKITKIKAGANDGIAMLLDPKGVLNEFLYYFFSAKTKYLRQCVAPGNGQPNLNTEIIGNLPILVPPLPEQRAIADLLSTWDAAIEKTERLIAAKERALKGYIRKLIGEKTVQKRKWPIVPMGQLFEEVTERVGNKKLIPHSISAGIGFVSHLQKWGKDISGKQYKNYTHLKAGEFAYNKGNSKLYQQGCMYLLKEGEICVPNVFVSFRPKDNQIYPGFYAHYFAANYHARELKKYITSGARSDGLLNLNKNDFFKMLVLFPTYIEQKKIAELLDCKCKEIDIYGSILQKYKNQKLGLMQKILTGKWQVKNS